MTVSVVTVCLNAKDFLLNTFASLEMQTYKDIQHVIIDGGSTDGSIEILREYANSHDNVVLISEPDNGIYDAMNKGVKNSDGEYVFFLNAGDLFYAGDTVEKFVKYATDGTDIYYGNVVWGEKEVKQEPDKLCLFDLIYRERMICHQGIFAKRSLLQKIPFDCGFKICGDRVWLIESLKSNATYKHLKDFTVAKYDLTGVSSVSAEFYDESLDIGKKFGGNSAVIFIKIKRKLKKILF